jgi:hypothetical protein
MASRRDPHNLMGRVTRPFARKGISRVSDGRWLVWGVTADRTIVSYYFTANGKPESNSEARLGPLQWTTDFAKVESLPDLRACQAKMLRFVRNKLLPSVKPQVDAWWAAAGAPNAKARSRRIVVQLDLRGPHDELLTLRGPATVMKVASTGRLGLYDASKVRARLYDSKGRRVPLCPFDDIRELGDRLSASRKNTEVWVMFDQVGICDPQLIAEVY